MGYHAKWDTMLSGIPCLVGYRAKWDYLAVDEGFDLAGRPGAGDALILAPEDPMASEPADQPAAQTWVLYGTRGYSTVLGGTLGYSGVLTLRPTSLPTVRVLGTTLQPHSLQCAVTAAAY